jgi:hypothetical protein
MTVSKCGNHKCRCVWETVTSEMLAPTVGQQWKLLSEPGFTGLKDEPDYETATL